MGQREKEKSGAGKEGIERMEVQEEEREREKVEKLSDGIIVSISVPFTSVCRECAQHGR